MAAEHPQRGRTPPRGAKTHSCDKCEVLVLTLDDARSAHPRRIRYGVNTSTAGNPEKDLRDLEMVKALEKMSGAILDPL